MLGGETSRHLRGTTMTLSSHVRRTRQPHPPPHEPSQAWMPPEETTWQRYSPNGESIVSGLASLLLHAALLAIILTGLWAIFDPGRPPAAAEFEPVGVEDGDGRPGGGIANDQSSGLLPGAPPPNSDEIKPVNLDDRKRPSRIVPAEDLAIRLTQPPAADDPLGEAVSRKLNGRTTRPNLGAALRDIMSAMQAPGVRGPSKTETSVGNKPGPGAGNETGPGTGHSPTWERMQRWEIVFSTESARHYLQQLDALGAVVAVIDPQDRVMTVRNLKERPAQLELRDVMAMGRMFWVDDLPDSAESVGRELGLSFAPSAVMAFFPKSLEEELAAKERAVHG